MDFIKRPPVQLNETEIDLYESDRNGNARRKKKQKVVTKALGLRTISTSLN